MLPQLKKLASNKIWCSLALLSLLIEPAFAVAPVANDDFAEVSENGDVIDVLVRQAVAHQ